MMAEKARLFGDGEAVNAIREADSPGAAKALGRSVVELSEERWCSERLEIVTRGSVAKFGSSAELEDYLVGSTGRVLVEVGPVDLVRGMAWHMMRARAELVPLRRAGSRPIEDGSRAF
jgi:hypothetical protein